MTDYWTFNTLFCVYLIFNAKKSHGELFPSGMNT